MKNSWQKFISAVVVQLLLPLTPLVIELWLTGRIDEKTYAISAAMYVISIGVATKYPALLNISILVSFLFSAIFGYLTTGNAPYFPTAIPAIVSIFSFMLIHGFECYDLHVRGNRFVEFGGEDD